MSSVEILINSFSKVSRFHKAIETIPGDFDLKQGRYTVDAKSLLGIYSLDLSRPAVLIFQSSQSPDEILKAIDEFVVKDETGSSG